MKKNAPERCHNPRQKIMKTRNTTVKLIATVIAMAIATIWTIRGASAAEAVIAIIRQTGMFSLAQGQATSAHVVNTGEERGQASSFDFGPLGLEEGQRMAIRVELMVEGASRNHPGFIATQEVHNVGDGKTTVFLPYME